MKLKQVMSVIAMMVIVSSMIPFAAAQDGAEISITDSRDVTTTLAQPATHVASFGAFATNTLVGIGNLSNVVILDASSEYSKSGIPEVQNFSADKFVTVSSTNKDAVVQKMLGLVDNGTWNKSTDVIFGYGYSYLSSLWDELEGYGFKVITFYPDSYDGIVQVVKDIETVVGSDHDVSDQMAYVKKYIADTLVEKGINNTEDKVKAIYVSFSGSVMYLGNKGSVTVDFITFAGGVNAAQDNSIDENRYAVDYSAILQLDPDFILLDGYYPLTVEDFKANIGDNEATVYKLNKSWNSYCPDATEGLWTVASLFYPDYFEGEIPTNPQNNGGDNTMLYAGVGAVVVVGAIVAVALMMRRKK